MQYHGALHSKHLYCSKMLKKRKIPFLLLFLWTCPGAIAGPFDITTYAVHPNGEREDRGGTSVVYACNAGKEAGPCVDNPVMCTSQGGRFVGYCFFENKYEGVCCIGLNPANATLTTKAPGVHDDSTSAPSQPTPPPPPSFTTQTFPPAPTMTTQTMPPASTLPPAPTMTSDTLPPAPTMTTQTMPPSSTMPTQTMPPAPTMTSPPPPSSSTLPPAPTMTSDTLPPAPTMTTQTMPPSSTMPTETLPPAPTMTTQTMPPSSSMPTQTMPPAPTMTTQTMPPSSTMPTQTMPPAPSQPTETLPPAPTPPTAPSLAPPGVHDDSTPPQQPGFPTMPPAPSQPTQTMPPAPTQPTAPTMTTQTMPPSSTMPPAPTQPTQTMPPAPTQPTQTLPPAPTQPTETLPPAPTMTTQTMPPSSSLSTQTMPPAPTAPTMTTQTLPPAPTETLPPSSTMPTQTMPPAPTMTTQSLPPSSSMPPAPTMTTQALPSETPPQTPAPPQQPNPPETPSVPQLPTSPAPPSQPTAPTQPPPPSAAAKPVTTPHPPHFDESSTSTQHTFPNFPTQTFPTMSTMSTMSTPSSTTNSFPTMSTPSNSTHPHFPNITAPNFPTAPTTEETSTVSEETPPPSFDVPGGSGCGQITTEVQSFFENPSYPSLDTESNVYEYSVMPQEGYCALRIEFLEAILASKGMEGCSTDSVVIVNSGDTPTTPLCGLLNGYQLTVRSEPEQPIRLVVTAQSQAHLWRINLTQISCQSIQPYQYYESPDCGVKNPKQPPPGVSIHQSKEEPKVVPPIKLLKSKRKPLRDIMSIPNLAPSKLLQSSVLNRESSIKIVRGNETGVNEWPWQALLMVYGRPLCGASIINEEWLVTAGHCVQLSLRYPLQSVLTVDLGDHDLLSSKETKNVVVKVEKIVPNAQNEGVRNDIALIKLAQKINFGKTIRPVCLPEPKSPADTFAGQTGITTGWGRTEDAVISPVLREAELPIVSNERCRQQWSAVGEGGGSIIESGMICVGGGDVGPCNGDSGGPLVVHDEDDDKWRLVGLTSFGLLRGCAVPGVPSVYARLTSYLDWLALNLAN